MKIEEGEIAPQKPKTLFSLSDEILAFETALDCMEEQGDDELAREIDQYLDTLGVERDRKLDGYASLIRELETRSQLRRAEAERIMARANTDDNKAKRLKERLQGFFMRHELTEVDTARYRIAIVDNGRIPAGQVVVEGKSGGGSSQELDLTIELVRRIYPKTLFDLSDSIVAFDTELDALEEKGQEEVDRRIDGHLAGLGDNRNQGLEAYVSLIKEVEAFAKVCRPEAARLTARAKWGETKAERLKDRLKKFFKDNDLDKVETGRYRIAIANNGGQLPLVYEKTPEELPEKYVTIEKKVGYDGPSIRRALDANIVIEGITYGTRGQSIRIT